MKNKHLISNIASLRIKEGLTQLALSRKVGVTESTIANWEKGRSDLKWIENVVRLCDALKCQPKDLISDNPLEEIRKRHEKNKKKVKNENGKVVMKH